jgi:hypothetical protein
VNTTLITCRLDGQLGTFSVWGLSVWPRGMLVTVMVPSGVSADDAGMNTSDPFWNG